MLWALFRALAGATFIIITTISGSKTIAAADFETCENASGEAAIVACTRAISSGRYNGHDLAVLYSNRGVEYSAKGDHENAIADYNEAIRLDPKIAEAYNNRGNAWRNKGDYDRAIADYNEAIRLDPTPGGTSVTSTAPSLITMRRSGSIRNMPKPTTIAA